VIDKSLHVFLVDDDESIRRSLLRLLSSAGYTVEAFPSAAQFLDSVPPETKGTLILDLRMPRMDGLELQRWLKELGSPLQVVIITAHAQPDDREQAMSHGAAGFLQKPFNSQSLLDLIEETRRNQAASGF
jgi:two-component system, LuxR family, response regulator FixJ